MPGGMETPGGKVIVPEGAPEAGAAGAAALLAAALGAAEVKLGRFCAKTQEDSIPIMANITITAKIRETRVFCINRVNLVNQMIICSF